MARKSRGRNRTKGNFSEGRLGGPANEKVRVLPEQLDLGKGWSRGRPYSTERIGSHSSIIIN